MRIGIIGAGKIGSTVGRLWVDAGHEVKFSSRHPEELQSMAGDLGPRASAGTPQEAAAFGEVVMVTVPLKAMPQLAREIGIRMAIGARGSDVLTQFLVESIVMGIAGGVAGLALGITGAALVAHFTGWATVISPIIMLIAVAFSGAVGVFFGYYPARKAAALNPIQALRYE